MNARGILLLVSALAGPWVTACGDDQRVRPPPSNPELDAFSKPGTPAPDQADNIQEACNAMLEHEAEGCGGDVAPEAAEARDAVGDIDFQRVLEPLPVSRG